MIDLAHGPHLMGIINVTPDSFSDGGQFIDPKRAIEHGMLLVSEGAAILDIGGESTRPGSETVSVDEEITRVIPVIEGLKNCGAVISVDTRNAATMTAAVKAGATMVNDVTALTHDPKSLSVVAGLGINVCLMHMQGDPKTMQVAPHYENVVEEVYAYLSARIDACRAAGVAQDKIIVDPGIGFGKNLDHNLKLLQNLDKLQSFGVAVLLGVSRKSFISKIMNSNAPDDRLAGSLAAALWGLQQGVQIFRVHDVAETKQAFAVLQSIQTR